MHAIQDETTAAWVSGLGFGLAIAGGIAAYATNTGLPLLGAGLIVGILGALALRKYRKGARRGL